jgi:hypothetical protein
MAHPAGESESDAPRLNFDRRLKLEFHGSSVTSDAGLLAYGELDEALGLSAMAGEMLADTRTGKNGRHGLVGMLRQSVFGRLAGYEDVNDADRLGRDPAMRWIVGGRAVTKQAASASQMGRFETAFLASDANLVTLADLSRRWIDRVHGRRPPNGIVLDMDSSVSPTFGDQEGTAYNGHFAGIYWRGGWGVLQDFAEAVKWERLAAEQGFPEAQIILGTSYWRGKGVPLDLVLAHMWLNLASAQQADAGSLRDTIAKEMTPGQIAEAQRLAREWKPVPYSPVIAQPAVSPPETVEAPGRLPPATARPSRWRRSPKMGEKQREFPSKASLSWETRSVSLTLPLASATLWFFLSSPGAT